jgi:hypothetical protein
MGGDYVLPNSNKDRKFKSDENDKWFSQIRDHAITESREKYVPPQRLEHETARVLPTDKTSFVSDDMDKKPAKYIPPINKRAVESSDITDKKPAKYVPPIGKFIKKDPEYSKEKNNTDASFVSLDKIKKGLDITSVTEFPSLGDKPKNNVKNPISDPDECDFAWDKDETEKKEKSFATIIAKTPVAVVKNTPKQSDEEWNVLFETDEHEGIDMVCHQVDKEEYKDDEYKETKKITGKINVKNLKLVDWEPEPDPDDIIKTNIIPRNTHVQDYSYSDEEDYDNWGARESYEYDY